MGVRGLVLAAALAAVMSTSSGALIACATVANNDIWSRLRGAVPRDGGSGEPTTRSRATACSSSSWASRSSDRHRAERCGRGADRRVQPAGRRAAGADPRRSAVAARHGGRGAGRRVRRRRRGDRPDGDVRHPRQRADLLRAAGLAGRVRGGVAWPRRRPTPRGPGRLARAPRGPDPRTPGHQEPGSGRTKSQSHKRNEAKEEGTPP